VNGDGYDDVIVGAPHFDDGQTDEGGAWVFLGSATGLSQTPAWSAESDQQGSLFGRWVGSAGDVNGDGYDDVIVGAHFYDDDQPNEGRAFVYDGSANGLSSTPDWIADGNQANAWFGRAVSSAGDVNHDGYDDVIVGAPKFDNDQANEGRAFGFYGSPAGLSPTPNWIAEADQADAWYGRRVSRAGDVNADGYDDVIIAAPNYDTANPDGGKVFIYYGSSAGLEQAPAWTPQLDQDHAWFGRSVSTAGDVNGDGFDDVIIGAPQYDDGQKDEGAAWVFEGSAEGLGERVLTSLRPNGTPQRAEVRADRRLPEERDRHRLARGSGRPVDQAHRGADRAPQDTRTGPPLQARASPDGGQAPPPARVPQAGGRRALPSADPAPRAEALEDRS
jgi:FG-GAP repeat protein